MKEHELKSWPENFGAVLDGRPFEVRKFDRQFEVGDTLLLREWDPVTEMYTGGKCRRDVTHILSGAPGIDPDYCVLGISGSPERDA